MGRYDNQAIKRTFSEKRVFSTTLYPEIKLEYGDTYVISTEEDRLDLLAQQFYGDPNLWWIIAEANALGKGTLRIPAGQQLRIPRNVSLIQNNLAKVNQ